MVSVSNEGVSCEKCGRDAGVTYSQLRTGDSSFACGSCGWFWETTVLRFGEDLLAQLRRTLGDSANCPRWSIAEPILRQLSVLCDEYREKGDGLRERINVLLAKSLVERGADEWREAVDLSSMVSLFVLRDGKPVYDYVEGYRRPASPSRA